MSEQDRSGLIRRGRALIAQEGSLNWQWGDLLAEVAPVGAQSDAQLMSYLEDIGWFDTDRTLATAKQLRKTALAWPADRRVAHIAFTSHAELCEAANRFAILNASVASLSKRQARRLAGRKPMKDDGDAVARLSVTLSEPATLAAAVADPDLGDRLLALASQVDREKRRQVVERDIDLGERSPLLCATGHLQSALATLRRAGSLTDRLSDAELSIYATLLADVLVAAQTQADAINARRRTTSAATVGVQA